MKTIIAMGAVAVALIAAQASGGAYPIEKYKELSGVIVAGSWHSACGPINVSFIGDDPGEAHEFQVGDQWFLILKDVNGVPEFNRKAMSASFRGSMSFGLFRGVPCKTLQLLDDGSHLLLIFRGQFDKRMRKGATLTLKNVEFQSDDFGGSMRYAELIIAEPIILNSDEAMEVDPKQSRPPIDTKKGEQPGAAQPATQPADKVPVKDQPPTPTSKPAPR